MLKNVVKLLFSLTTVLMCHFYILVYRMENKSGLYNEVFKISYAAHKITSSKVLETYRRKIGRELKRRLVANVQKYRSFNLRMKRENTNLSVLKLKEHPIKTARSPMATAVVNLWDPIILI